jgi:hypothetical protein
MALQQTHGLSSTQYVEIAPLSGELHACDLLDNFLQSLSFARSS